MDPQTDEVTLLLDRVQAGDRGAENRLFELVLPHLRKLAQHLLNRERPNHTLQGTELVNQMYVRLAGKQLSLRNRAHFFAIAARAMRRELIEYARRRPDVGLIPIEGLPEGAIAASGDAREITFVIDELLDQMRETMPEECSVVELKFFFGMTDEETADALGLPLRTTQAKWQDARIWLFEHAENQQWKPQKNAYAAPNTHETT